MRRERALAACPVSPDLEQLDRQAKELLRGIHVGDVDVIAELRITIPNRSTPLRRSWLARSSCSHEATAHCVRFHPCVFSISSIRTTLPWSSSYSVFDHENAQRYRTQVADIVVSACQRLFINIGKDKGFPKMDAQQLHARLHQLHTELQQIESVDADERRALQQLMADIHEILEKEEGPPIQKYGQLSERLRNNIAQLEASHPTVTMLMGQVIDALAKMGI